MSSDWTYEMLRYAFSWNEDSADKALKYVVNSRSGTESLSEFQLLDILLLTILTEKDEVERTSALIFLEEHGSHLVFDYTRLHKVYSVLDNILGSPVDGNTMTYSLKSQVLVTYTTLLIQFNCFESDVARFEGFVDLLHTIVKHTNKSSDRILRSYACECLHELESWYPGLLFPLLGEDWSVPKFVDSTPQHGSVGQNTLGKFVNDELLHIHESYARLFFTTFQHFTEQVVQEALKDQPPDEGDEHPSISIEATPSASRQNTPPGTPRGLIAQGGNTPSTVPSEAFRFRIPPNCHPGPERSFDLAPEQTPPRLPRKLVRTMTRSISLVLETMPTSSSWTKIFFAERLSLFIRVLALPCRVVFHHFSPLLHASRASLLHAFLVVTSLFAKEVESTVSEAVVDRLFALTQDTAVEPCFRLLAINWLISLSYSPGTGSHPPLADLPPPKPIGSQLPLLFALLWDRVEELCPRWHDPLELKEMKLQALLYCFRISSTLPKNLLVVLESLSEFKYCCRPVGAHAVVFRFLLRVLIFFAPEMDRLEVPQCLCDLLRSHPKLLPSVLSVERRTNSKAVQYKLLRSLGEFVSRLEPPSRIQCYFGLLVTLAQTSWLDPSFVMTALKRLVFSPSSSLSWQVGMRVLVTVRQVMLYHPQAVIYQTMLRLLHHLATYQQCVDIRDRALLYLRLLTHSGSASLGTLLHGDPEEVARMTQMLTPVLPKTIRLVNGPVPFLTFFKSLDERKHLGILDGQCTVFILPGHRPPGPDAAEAPSKENGPTMNGKSNDMDNSGDWERRWGDSGTDQQYPKEWSKLAEQLAQLGNDVNRLEEGALQGVIRDYMAHVQASPASIRLPFVLRYREVQADTSDALKWLDFPRQIFSLELSFSTSEHYVPIDPIRIPFIADSEEEITAGESFSGFPRMNKLLLRLQPISSVPTSFGVNITFNDYLGHMYFGSLETFNVSFQDLFLPVRLPLCFWGNLFEMLWTGCMMGACWSVKVLDLDKHVVEELISSQLGPFVVLSEVRLEDEDFDFEQEEYFEHWAEMRGDEEDCEDIEVEVNVNVICVIVFIPPKYHLLMRFAISSHSTVVRILTDRFRLLSYMDSFFISWIRRTSDLKAARDKSGSEESSGNAQKSEGPH